MLTHGGPPPDGLRGLPEVSLSWSDAARTCPVHRTSRGPTPVRGTPSQVRRTAKLCAIARSSGPAISRTSCVRWPYTIHGTSHVAWPVSSRHPRAPIGDAPCDNSSTPSPSRVLSSRRARTILIRLGFRGADAFTGYWINLVVDTAGLWLAVLVLAPSGHLHRQGQGPSRAPRRVSSCGFPKSGVCIIATSGRRPDLASPGQSSPSARHARHHQAAHRPSPSSTSSVEAL